MLKRKKIMKLLELGCLSLFLLGCAKESFLVQKESSTIVLEEEVVLSEDSLLSKNNEVSVSELEKNSSKTETQIVVHICGAVNQPGVYYLKEDQRLYEGIQKAGGFREDADQDYLNQALTLEDGMKIIVPVKEELEAEIDREEESGQTQEVFVETQDGFIQTEDETIEKAIVEGKIQEKNANPQAFSEEIGGKVDLNTADEALLCTLPGIGESRAKSIIAYREEHGRFQKIEDVMQVSGIKEAAFEKIKNYIIVKKETNIR